MIRKTILPALALLILVLAPVTSISAQETELRETIRRAYVAAGRANPSNDDINLAMVKLKAKPRVFSKLVEFVKKIDTMTKID